MLLVAVSMTMELINLIKKTTENELNCLVWINEKNIQTNI